MRVNHSISDEKPQRARPGTGFPFIAKLFLDTFKNMLGEYENILKSTDKVSCFKKELTLLGVGITRENNVVTF